MVMVREWLRAVARRSKRANEGFWVPVSNLEITGCLLPILTARSCWLSFCCRRRLIKFLAS